MLLLACVEPSSQPPGDGPPAAPDQDPRRLEPLALPDTLPFTAWTRTTPITLVDEHGTPLLVLDAIGVEVEVQRLLVDRAWVTCTGCRAEVDAWVQRSALFAGDAAADGPSDPLLAWLSAQGDALTGLRRHGFTVAEDGAWISPPWHDEGGYGGDTLVIRAEGAGFVRVEPAPSPEDP